MNTIKCINRIAGISWIVSFLICAAFGQMAAEVNNPPTIVIIGTAIILIDMLWFILRGLVLVLNETLDR